MQMPKVIAFGAIFVLFASQPCLGQQARVLPIQAHEAPQLAPPRQAETLHAPVAINAAPDEKTVALSTDRIRVGAVLVEGASEIDSAAFMPVIAPFIGHQLQPQDLQDLLAVISGVARSKGYVLCRSTIRAQALTTGVLTVSLDLGRIDRVDFVGNDSPAVRAVLGPLVGKPATQTQLERQLMLAADIPGILIGQVSYLHDGDKGVLQVEVRHKQFGVRATLDNRGISSLGPVRMALALDQNGLLGNERLSASAQIQTTPVYPDELIAAAGRLAYALDNGRTELALSAATSHTQPGGRLTPFNYSGDVRDIELAFDHPLIRRRATSLWVGSSVAYQSLDQFQGPTMLWKDRTTLLRLSINGYVPVAKGRLRAGLSEQWLLPLPGMTKAGDGLASRPDAGADALILSGWANWEGPIVGPFTARIAFSGQLADASLPLAQQLAIGGPDFGRAYDFAERTGDDGALGSVELQFKLPTRVAGSITQVFFYGFADAGYVANLNNAFGTGTLVSAGFGSRLNMKKLRLGLELALPINQVRYDADNHSPRVSVTMGTDF